MSWEDKKNIARIFRLFKRVKNQIFNEDIEALKELNQSVENASKAYVEDNLLYAKLLAVVLRLNFEHYGSMKLAIKETNSIFTQSVNTHLYRFTDTLNRRAEIDYLKSIGFDLESLKTEDEKVIEKHDEITRGLPKSWTFENVSKSFYNSANDFLKDVNNYQ